MRTTIFSSGILAFLWMCKGMYLMGGGWVVLGWGMSIHSCIIQEQKSEFSSSSHETS